MLLFQKSTPILDTDRLNFQKTSKTAQQALARKNHKTPNPVSELWVLKFQII